MQDTHPNGQERTDHNHTSIAAIEHQHLGTDSVRCQVCKRVLREGDTVTVYAFRAAGTPQFDIGYVMCGADTHHHPTEAMRGVHELVATGRIGRCTDVANQQSWMVLLAPTLREESPAQSRRLRTSADEPTHHACRATHPPLSSPDAASHSHTRQHGHDLQSSASSSDAASDSHTTSVSVPGAETALSQQHDPAEPGEPR